MQQSLYLSLVGFFLMVQGVKAQKYDQLQELKNHTVKVYYSAGQEERATTIVKRVDKAMSFYQQLLGFKTDVVLLILVEADWSKYTSFPVYGMPHYDDDKTLIVAAEDNAFWKSFLPPLDKLPGDLRKQVQKAYRNKDGNLSMEAFFDILALHELGHAFHFQGKLNMQRKWMGELFVNILLHIYIAEKEPKSLPALTLFPKMVISGGTKEFTYTSLKDVEERYDEIGQQHPKNYGWYQSRWHSAAAGIYDSAGKQIGKKLWDALKNEEGKLTDDQLIIFFESAGARSVADMIKNWDIETIR